MEGLVLADNAPMLALMRKLKFTVEPSAQEGSVVRVVRTFGPAKAARAAPPAPSAQSSQA